MNIEILPIKSVQQCVMSNGRSHLYFILASTGKAENIGGNDVKFINGHTQPVFIHVGM